MIKRMEKADGRSCWNKAADDELVFVLLARDVAAPRAVREWANERVALGKNRFDDSQIEEALKWAKAVENQQRSGSEASLGFVFHRDVAGYPDLRGIEDCDEPIATAMVCVQKLRTERDRLLEGINHAYQLAGANDAPVEVLDNYSALANRRIPPHEYQAALPSPVYAERNALKSYLDSIAAAIYPSKEPHFTYAVPFIVDEIVKLRNYANAMGEDLRKRIASLNSLIDAYERLESERDALAHALAPVRRLLPGLEDHLQISVDGSFACTVGEMRGAIAKTEKGWKP